MKKIFVCVVLLLVCSVCFTGSWESSPANWENSEANWENSPANWKNSPANWDNSEANYNRQNGVYDSKGKTSGYTTPKAGGGVNIYDNDGDRIGYGRG